MNSFRYLAWLSILATGVADMRRWMCGKSDALRRLTKTGILLTAAITIPASATIQMPTTVWSPVITRSEVIDEIFAGNYRYALQLAKDLLIQELRQKINDGSGAKVLAKALAKQLNRIDSDPTKSQTQKEDEFFELVNASLEPEASAPVGPLNLVLRYSVEYGVTRLEWDAKTQEDVCYFGTVSGMCYVDAGMNPQNCSSTGGGGAARYYRQPHYWIYRIVNGQETPITWLRGYAQATSTAQPFQGLWPSVSGALQSYYQQNYGRPFPNAVPNGKVFFYDVHGDFREPSTTLSYRVHSDDTAPDLYAGCGDRRPYDSTATADANGDGRMDFLPTTAYSKYFGKYYGWLLGVIDSILQ